MKNSEHHNEHQRNKAIKEANSSHETDITPEDFIENRHFKKQFDANHQEKKPHKEDHRTKKVSKKTSTDEVKESTEPAHLQHQSERWASDQIKKTQEKNIHMTHKDHHYKK